MYTLNSVIEVMANMFVLKKEYNKKDELF